MKEYPLPDFRDHKIKEIMNPSEPGSFFPSFALYIVILEFAIKTKQLLVNLPYMAPMQLISEYSQMFARYHQLPFCSKGLMGLTWQLAASKYDFQSVDRAAARVQGCQSFTDADQKALG